MDPEQYDRSEEHFASSLDRQGEASGGEPVVDVTTALEAAARAERLAQLRPARRTIVLVEPKSPERPLEPGEWRREVSSRVSRYRARRRPRPERNRSLSLNFEPAPASPTVSSLLPATKEVAPPPISMSAQQLIVEQDAVPEAGNLMTMQVEDYGIERYWPKTAPRNENPFWKRAVQSAHAEAVDRDAAKPEEISHSAVSRHFDGSIVSDLTSDLSEVITDEEPGSEEASGTLERIIEFPATLQAANEETSASTSRGEAGMDPAPVEAAFSAAAWSSETEELAEQPAASTRVFEAEEISQAEFATEAATSVEPAPPIATVELPATPQSAHVEPEIRSFAPIAPVYLRAAAEATDGFISLSGFLLFSTILMWFGALPHGRGFTMLVGILPGFFWSLYQYLFLVNAGSTPGMRLAGLKLAGFDEKTVSRQRRRARALSMCVSTLAVGLGFVWALLDIDHLCWHDRASRTFLTRQ
jgi:uncharacterized RDD family membrane protein YckC